MPGLGAQAAIWTIPAACVAFLLLTVIETHRPRQPTDVGGRWITNIGLYLLVAAIGTMIAPQRFVEAALSGWSMGPLAWLDRSAGAGVTLAAGLILLDAMGYGLHRLQHCYPFWRLHAVHHADLALDASTGLRHHPGEYLVNAALGATVLVVLGLPAWVVPVYGFIVMLSDLWTHANVALPPAAERVLAAVLVTPGVHRVHHSAEATHYNTNFGSVLSIWDRAFGTWRGFGSDPLRFGVPGVGEQGLLRAISAPFRQIR